MSRQLKIKYSAFQRSILKEFVSEKYLKLLDKCYTLAKINRMIKFYLR